MAIDPARLRRSAFRRGHVSEWIAAAFLTLKSYRVVSLRERTPLGEIDLIAVKGALAVFVEVKARRSLDDAVFAVTAASQRRIREASDLWLARQKHGAGLSSRYDIVAVLPWQLPVHLVDAF